jgi:2-polyprenyl-3-methyl-5-hydroxy-6-metoxy-1,4-benzoquinol methylase
LTHSPLDPGFAERRARARAELDAIDPAKGREGREGGDRGGADPLRRAWFEAVYAQAEDDPARVPWANLAPHPLAKAFVDFQLGGLDGLRVLDVGCGLGDNAEHFAAAGAKVTAFDLVEAAVAWARRRFPQSKVDIAPPTSSPRRRNGGAHSISSTSAIRCRRWRRRSCRGPSRPSLRFWRRAESCC